VNQKPTEPNSEAAEPVQQEVSSAPKKKKQPVVIYMVILVVAVVVMLAVSYGMQLRSNQQLESLTQTVSGLKDSYTALETLNELQATIDTQTGQISDLEDQLEAAQSAAEQQEESEAALKADLETKEQADTALRYVIALQAAYQDANLELCQQIIAEMEEQDLVQYLSETSPVEGGISAKEQYEAIAMDAASVANAGEEEDDAETTDPAESTTPAN
jgi:chromosome segregation ATPase